MQIHLDFPLFSKLEDLKYIILIKKSWYDSLFLMNYSCLPDIGLMVRVFTNGPGDLGSIPGRVIPKTQKRYLMPPCLTLNIIRQGSRVKWVNPGKGVAISRTPWCSSYRKRNLRVTLDYGRQLYLLINGKNLRDRFIES